MRVRELMTKRVLKVGPDATLKQAARILVDHRISGLPVCDAEGRVLGVLSEGDLLYKEHDPGEGRRGPLGWLIEGAASEEYAKAEARTVRSAMSAPAVTVTPNESASQAARVMCERRVNRLPVVDGDRLVGIVTRADLVRAFVRDDAEIERELREDVLGRALWVDEGQVEVDVAGGHVVLSGELHVRSDVELLRRLAARVPGVVSVESAVGWEIDDTGRRAAEHAR